MDGRCTSNIALCTIIIVIVIIISKEQITVTPSQLQTVTVVHSTEERYQDLHIGLQHGATAATLYV